MGRIHGLGVQDENGVLRKVLLHVTRVSIVISVTYTYVMMYQGGGLQVNIPHNMVRLSVKDKMDI